MDLIEIQQGWIVRDGKATATLTLNEDNKKSIKVSLNDSKSISDLTKLDVSLADEYGNIIATNRLNEVGFFLHGTSRNKLSENLSRELREDNLNFWKKRYNEAMPENSQDWKVGDLMPLISDENAGSIDTSFISRSEDIDGTLNKKMLSAWDQGKTNGDLKNLKIIIIEYTIDGEEYKSVIPLNE